MFLSLDYLNTKLSFTSFILLSLVSSYCNYILYILGCVSSLMVKEHYMWHQSSFLDQHAFKYYYIFLGERPILMSLNNIVIYRSMGKTTVGEEYT
jgi:hypothetical protein